MYEIFSFLKQAGIVIYFLNLLIVIEFLLWNRKESILQPHMHFSSQLGFQWV